MRIAVVSCWNYRDAWRPMLKLLNKFWRNHQALELWRDSEENPIPWCRVVSISARGDAPVLLLQEDFFVNAPVNTELVEHGLKLLESRDNIGAVRLYPCPGATDASDDPYFGPVARHSAYRTSCQATIWKPAYLKAIAERYNTPSEFELEGSAWASQHLSAEVWAFKREVQPWPISYFCSAISRGKWEPAALEFCRQQGIDVDTSMRPIASAQVR